MNYILPCVECARDTKIILDDTQDEIVEDSGIIYCPLCGYESPSGILEEDVSE